MRAHPAGPRHADLASDHGPSTPPVDLGHLALGDTVAVLGCGLDGVYPPGLAVAKVERIERASTDQFAHVVMRPIAGVESHKQLLVLLTEPARLPAAPAPGEPAPRKAGRR